MKKLWILLTISLFASLLWYGKTTSAHSASQLAAQQQQAKREMMRSERFEKARVLLRGKQVPFDPDILLDRNWKNRLAPIFAQMPEMRATIHRTQPLRGVVLADTLYLPERIALAGDTIIIARQVLFQGKGGMIRGPHNIYLFPIEAFGITGGTGHIISGGRITVDTSGVGRKEWLQAKYAKFAMLKSSTGQSGVPQMLTTPLSFDLKRMGVLQRSALMMGSSAMMRGTAIYQPGQSGNDGSDGNDGGAGNDGQGGTPGSNGGNGGDGQTGSVGGDGTPGNPGGNGGDIYAEVSGCCSWVSFITNGGDGGKGGTGGAGGAGGNGGDGGDGATGGNGGNGATGATGGNGGDGGDAGNGGFIEVWITVEEQYGWVDCTADGGQRGDIGEPGDGGSGGQGGNGGLGSSGPNGFNGSSGDQGSAGNYGAYGAFGANGYISKIAGWIY